MELLVPAWQGAHSSIGRATNRGMDKMRAVVDELVKEDEARRAAAKKGHAANIGSGDAVQDGDEFPPALTLALRPRRGLGVPGAKRGAKMLPDKVSPMGRSVRAGLGLGVSPKSQSGEAAESPQASNALPDEMEDSGGGSPSAEKASPAFTAQGTEDAVFDECTRVNLKRFFYKGKRKGETNPEVGHYRVQENLVTRRIPLVMDFGARQKHESRRRPESLHKSTELGPEDLSKLDFRWATTGSMTPNPSMFSTMSPHSASRSAGSLASSWPEGQFSTARSLMSTSLKRPDLNNIPGSRMCLGSCRTTHEVSEPKELEVQDLKTSAVKRIPVWNFDKFQGRKGELGKEFQFFEVGKYDVRHDVVLAKPKVLTGFGKQLSRAEHHVGHQKPKGMLDENGTACIQDRSLYRLQAPGCRKNVTHVMDMSKDLPRPPLIKHAAVQYDDSDPEVVAAVREREMTVDRTTLDSAIIHRHDFAPLMHHSIPRDRAGAGARIAQDDLCIRALHGHINYESNGAEKSPAELKDIMKSRAGLLTFDQTKARDPTRLAGEYSSLHRPRNHAAPDFSRSAPALGFSTCTSVKVLQRNRQHDAMPGWTAEAVDGGYFPPVQALISA